MLLVVDCKKSSTCGSEKSKAVSDEEENQILLEYYGLIE